MLIISIIFLYSLILISHSPHLFLSIYSINLLFFSLFHKDVLNHFLILYIYLSIKLILFQNLISIIYISPIQPLIIHHTSNHQPILTYFLYQLIILLLYLHMILIKLINYLFLKVLSIIQVIMISYSQVPNLFILIINSISKSPYPLLIFYLLLNLKANFI